MRSYEHTLIARPDLSPQQAQSLAEAYSGVISENGGEVTKTEYWGLRNLSYRIKKSRKGHYLHFNLKAPAAAIDELERQERLSDDVLRYLTVKVEELDAEPSVLMQARSSREERSRRSHDDGPRGSDGDRPRRFDGPRGGDEDRPRRHEGPRGGSDEERPRRPRPAASDTPPAASDTPDDE